MLSSFEVKCGTRAAGRKPVRGVVFIATTAEALADERLPFLTKQLSLADVEAKGGDAAAQVRADRLRLRVGTIKEQGGGAAAQATARPLKLSMVEADGATLGEGNDPVNCLFDDDDVYSTSKGSNTNLVLGTSLCLFYYQ